MSMDFGIELDNIEFTDNEADMEMMYDFIEQLEKLFYQIICHLVRYLICLISFLRYNNTSLSGWLK